MLRSGYENTIYR